MRMSGNSTGCTNELTLSPMPGVIINAPNGHDDEFTENIPIGVLGQAVRRHLDEFKIQQNIQDLSTEEARELERNFIKAHFHQRVLAADNKGTPVEPIKDPDYIDYESRLDQHWCTVKSRAFGRINFQNDAKTSYKPAYIGLDDTDSHEKLLQLLLDHWQLPEPKLVVSLVGGARTFQFEKTRAKSMFKQGLLELATTTGAWILTPGSNKGVYEMVGSAVKDHIDATGSASMNNIVLLGIASWGGVAAREKLVDSSGRGTFSASYPVKEILGDQRDPNQKSRKRTEPLNPNHSHFILVDDGSRGSFGGEEKWRARFEEFLSSLILSRTESKPGQKADVCIPLVTLLVNGGDGSLVGCAESLPKKIPLVAVAGSSRAADVVAAIYKLCQNQPEDWSPERSELSEIYIRWMMTKPQNPEEVMGYLTTIAKYRKYISVFDLNQLGVESDEIGLDKAILSALYNQCDLQVSKMKAQMRLAIAWNRVDHAREEIFDPHHPLYRSLMSEKNFLHEIASYALRNDLPKFVELLLDHGLNLREFVTAENLKYLYEKGMERNEKYSIFINTLFKPALSDSKVRCCHPRGSVASAPSYLCRIGGMLKYILGHNYPNIYKVYPGEGTAMSSESVDGVEVFSDPAQHLFLWSILFNRIDLAKMFWRLSEDHIAAAIVGAAVMRSLSRESNHQEGIDITASYLENSMEFEKLANGILSCCWASDKQYTSDMLIREAPNWGHATVLSMAYRGEMEEFLAQPACYTKLIKIWRGDIALRTHLALILLFAFMPLTAFTLTFVRKRDDDSRLDERQPDHLNRKYSITGHEKDKSNATHSRLIRVTLLGTKDDEISYPEAIHRGLLSPIVKCIHYSLWYLTFLVVFALFMMTELRPYEPIPALNITEVCSPARCCAGTTISCLEIATYCYVLANFLEEMRQMWFRDHRTLKYAKSKVKDWFRDIWNNVDMLSHVLFFVAVILRFTLNERYFDWVRWSFSFSYMVYVIRFSQIFYVLEKLGPKLIMIRKMFVDLIFFLVFLTMTILIFGVITQTVLYPESQLEWTLVNEVVYKPYFQMYGELFLEEYQGYRSLLLAFYMIMTNILLLNLLIAMFSYTFERVQEKSAILWKYNYYAVVYEHFDRPYIPLLGTIMQVLRHCKCFREAECLKNTGTDFRRSFDSEHNSNLTKFVRVSMEKCIAEERKQRGEDMAHKVTSTARRLDMVIEQLGDLRDDITSQQMKSSNLSLGNTERSRTAQLQSLESKIDQLLKRQLDNSKK